MLELYVCGDDAAAVLIRLVVRSEKTRICFVRFFRMFSVQTFKMQPQSRGKRQVYSIFGPPDVHAYGMYRAAHSMRFVCTIHTC